MWFIRTVEIAEARRFLARRRNYAPPVYNARRINEAPLPNTDEMDLEAEIAIQNEIDREDLLDGSDEDQIGILHVKVEDSPSNLSERELRELDSFLAADPLETEAAPANDVLSNGTVESAAAGNDPANHGNSLKYSFQFIINFYL